MYTCAMRLHGAHALGFKRLAAGLLLMHLRCLEGASLSHVQRAYELHYVWPDTG